jgi:hypothetical protein
MKYIGWTGVRACHGLAAQAVCGGQRDFPFSIHHFSFVIACSICKWQMRDEK